MISTADFRNGMVVELENELLQIVEFQHVKPGKGGAFVRTKFKNLKSGRVLERTFRSGERMEEARIEEEKYQYLYHDGDLYHFMQTETFEQVVAGPDIVGDMAKYVKENEHVHLVFYKGRPIGVNIPLFVVLEVTQCDPGVQGDRATGGTKPATCETGLVIQVPLFLEVGTRVKVDTRTGAYIERVN